MFVASLACALTDAAAARPTAALTTIIVTLGKPVEISLALSKTSSIPVGRVTFVVTNKGGTPHAFALCTQPLSAVVRRCDSLQTRTKMLAKGQSDSLTVVLPRGEFLVGIADAPR